MSKNRVTAILLAFMGCLVITIIILTIRLATRPEQPQLATNDKNTVADSGNTEETPDSTPSQDETPDEPEVQPPVDEVPEEPEVKTEIVTKQYVRSKDADTNVNIRSEASTKGEQLGKLTYSDKATYIETVDGWHKIELNGITGYVSGNYSEIFEVEEEVIVEDTAEQSMRIKGTPDVMSGVYLLFRMPERQAQLLWERWVE